MSKKIEVGTWVVWKSGPPWRRQQSMDRTFIERHLRGKHKRGPFLVTEMLGVTKKFPGGKYATLEFDGKPLTVPYSSEPHAFNIYWLEPTPTAA